MFTNMAIATGNYQQQIVCLYWHKITIGQNNTTNEDIFESYQETISTRNYAIPGKDNDLYTTSNNNVQSQLITTQSKHTDSATVLHNNDEEGDEVKTDIVHIMNLL